MVRRLIDSGADFNTSDNFRWTLIFLASFNDQWEVVAELIKSGADVYIPNNNRSTASHFALK